MSRRRPLRRCPLCGREKPLTKDHVPPKGLFFKPRPTNSVTVFTCSDCNEGSDLDDEYFRCLIATTTDADSPLMQLWREKVVESTFKRSPALRAQLLEDMEKIRERHKTEPVMTFEDRALTDEEVEDVITFDANRISRVVRKIVRCLHFHHERTMLPLDATLEVAVDPLTIGEIASLIRNPLGAVGKQGEFCYTRVEGELPGSWNWLLFFYRTHHFRVNVSGALATESG